MPANDVVHVIDDDAAMRDSLAFLLQSADLVVKTYESAQAFLEVRRHPVSGCVITDVRMPGMSGMDLLRRLRDLDFNLPVIVITGHGDIPLAVEAMKSGATDFIEKPFEDEAILEAVRHALASRASDAKQQTAQAAIIEKLGTLTNRERDVLEGLVAGHPNKTIGYDLGISPRTVEIYRANVMTKMDAKSLSDLVRMALVGGIIGPAGSVPARER
jgi:two-component system response regulator FixJ